MLYVKKYQVATYKKAKYQSPTQYLVPQEIEKCKYDMHQKKYTVVGAVTKGRQDCGKLIHETRTKFKNYLKLLDKHKDPLYEVEMSQHHNAPGFYNPKYHNYNAKRMVEDDGFMPNGNIWLKRNWGTETWSNASPVPMYKEPYWHTTHSIRKSNDWIMEHLVHMENRISKNWLNKDEFKVIFETLEPMIIELPLQVTQQSHNNTLFQVAN